MIDFILRSPDFLMWIGFILFTGAISAALEARRARKKRRSDWECLLEEIRKAKLLKK